jgi:hypothetical protein
VIVSINQPAYLPWLGYFDRIRRSDLHIVLDHVQFEKGSYTNRCRIRQRDGREMWLTVPVEKGKPIRETMVGSGRWREKHRAALQQAYGWDAPLYTKKHMLDDICWWSTVMLAAEFPEPITTPIRSSWSIDVPGRKSELVLNLCKEVGATQYLSGPQGRNYLDLPAFDKAGIEVLYHDFPTDGDWGLSAVHHLFGPRSFEWPQLDSISDRCSPASAPGVAA